MCILLFIFVLYTSPPIHLHVQQQFISVQCMSMISTFVLCHSKIKKNSVVKCYCVMKHNYFHVPRPNPTIQLRYCAGIRVTNIA